MKRLHRYDVHDWDAVAWSILKAWSSAIQSHPLDKAFEEVQGDYQAIFLEWIVAKAASCMAV